MKKICTILLCVILSACSPIKYVEDGEYLLDDVEIVETAAKENNSESSHGISTVELYDYAQQQPNAPGLFFNKTSLRVYSLSGRDTSKWINRMIRKMGEAPVIYNEASTEKSRREMEGALLNNGYFNALVSTTLDTVGKKKVILKYNVSYGEPYKVRNYTEKVGDPMIDAALSKKSILHKEGISSGEVYNAEAMDKHIDEIVSFAREQGYYYFSKENLYYAVDSSLNSNAVDVSLLFRGNEDALTRYKIKDVTISSNLRNDALRRHLRKNSERTKTDTVSYRGVHLINEGRHLFLKPKVLYSNNFIRPGRYFSELLHERTYFALTSLGATNQVNIDYARDTAPSTLNAKIAITPSNIHYIQWGIDGTNTAGDFGVESYLTYQNKNLFKGSEALRMKLSGAYEFVRNAEDLGISNHNFFEVSPSISLSFPRFLCPKLSDTYIGRTGKTTFSLGYTWQNRPEFKKRYLAFDWKYQWQTRKRTRSHTLSLYDITYTRVPWILPAFDEQYLSKEKNALLRQNYSNTLITRTSYSYSLAKTKSRRTNSVSFSLDMAGTLPYLFTLKQNTDDGMKKMLGVPFSQYARADFDFSRVFNVRPRHTLAWHIGLGVASPYLNSTQIPYERRYFAGGSNSLRGWTTRTLGPGIYKASGESDFLNQTGDVKLLLQTEYRFHASQMIEYAAFLDAGNIWTIREYENQKGGAFYLNEFAKQIALSYGVGIRFDLSFFLLRFDFGMKAHDPSQEKPWVITHPYFKRDFAWHFGIGYPF